MTHRPALVVALAVLLAGCGRDTTRIVTTASPYGEEGLHVTGTAVVRTAPDYAVVTLGTDTVAVGARNARETNKSVMSKVLAAVKAQGVDAKDIHTVEYDLSSTYTPDIAGQRRRIQWRVRNRVEVRVRDTEKVADVVDAATDAGANSISGVRYAVEDLHKVRAQARERASKIAREKAEQLAKALGGTLGRLIAVRDGGSRGWWYGNSGGYASQANINMENARAVSPPMGPGTAEAEISTGQIAIEATEEVTYEIL